MKKLIVSFAVLALLTAPAGAQSNILGRLGERAKNAVENKLGEKVDRGVDNLLNGSGKDRKGKDKKTDETKAEAAPAGGWTCPECGAAATGKFCPECGSKKPEAKPAPAAGNWTCPECGATASGKFCPECGAKRPSGAPAPPAAEAPKRSAASGLAGAAMQAAGDVPNPYTVFDTPENPFDVPLGLPDNDDGDKPGLYRPGAKVSYCAYTYPAVGARGKTFFNAERGRTYSISFEKWNGEDLIHKTISIIDSLAIYMIDDQKQLITKIPLSAVQAAANYDVVKKEKILDERDIASSQGRWCYMQSGATETTREFAGHQASEVNSMTTYIDLETGITLEVTEGYAHDYTRNIHLGLYYPEIYDLPKGYTMVTQDFSEGIKKMDEMEQQWKAYEDKMKEMDLGNKSLEDMLKMIK